MKRVGSGNQGERERARGRKKVYDNVLPFLHYIKEVGKSKNTNDKEREIEILFLQRLLCLFSINYAKKRKRKRKKKGKA